MVSPIRTGKACKHALAVGSIFLTFLMCAPGTARAAATEEAILDPAAISNLEQQAGNAQAKEQCFLYTQLLHSLTELAGKQLADGQDDQAALTFHHIDTVAAKLQRVLARDAKRLKNAELLMEHTTRRLADMLHMASGDQQTALQSTLQHLNAVHDALLSQVFAQ